MNLSDEPAATVYARFELLAEAVSRADSNTKRRTLLALALDAARHPTLQPFRDDPLMPLDGRFISLDAQVNTTQAMFDALGNPATVVGSIGGALYLPATKQAQPCRVHVGYLPWHPLAQWNPPAPLVPVSPNLMSSAQKALEAALHLLLFSCPGETPPIPAPLFWSITGITTELLTATTGDSLQLPLTLALVSALADLPVGVGVGATGAIGSPGRVAPVRFVEEKRKAFLARFGEEAVFLTIDDGESVQGLAGKLGPSWSDRFALPKVRNGFFLPPNGVPTFLYAEVENAPTLWTNHASLFRQAVIRYESIFVDAVERYGGTVFGASGQGGDGMGAVFAESAQAVSAAVHLLRGTRAALWDAVFGDSLPVRVGIDTGYGEPIGGTWRGAGPTQALRVTRAASAYQILVSDTVHSAVTPAGWVNHGKHRLRDLADPITLWQVTAPGIQTVSVPPESLDTRHQNLPAASDLLIGRDTELQTLVSLLAKERFVTLTGAGGVGKTRLAIAAAERSLFAPETADRFSDGVFYVSLDDGIRDEGEIGRAVSQAAGIGNVNALSTKRMLLLLDNAEGLVGPLKTFIDSVAGIAAGVTFLITSRIAIRNAAEKRVQVLPLPMPRPDAEEEEWAKVPSVQLFMNRARRVNSDFAVVTQAGRDTLTRLLRRLDGLPLAIELAATRTRYLSIGEIDARLGESLHLLSTRESSLSNRQKTLLATLEWSYALLPESEKQLLQCISVFVGGFSAEAAEGVTDSGLDTLDMLASLEEQSLLVLQRTEKGEPPRFSLLQTVTEFARMKREGSSGDSARQRHARYFVGLAERNGGERITLSPIETEAFDALDRDIANVRAAWTYLLESKDNDSLVKIAVSLTDFLRRRGHARERFDWIKTALEIATSADSRRRLLYAHAMTLRDIGRGADAALVAEELKSLVRKMDDPVHLADALALHGTIATRTESFEEAECLFDQAERLYSATDHKRGMATTHSNRGFNALRKGEADRARALLEDALRLYHDIADEQGKAYAHTNLGYLLSEAGNYADAKRHYLHLLNYCRTNGDTMGCALSLFNLGEAMLHLDQGNGLSLTIAAAEIFTRIGHPYAGAASAECEKWSDKTNTAQGVFAALRRAASRRTLAELRESYAGG